MLSKIIDYLKQKVWTDPPEQAGPEAAPPRRQIYKYTNITLMPDHPGPPLEIILVRNRENIILSKYQIHTN